MLIEQLIHRVMAGRGIFARPDEMLVTVGGQHALYIAMRLLLAPGETIGVEDPGYPDAVAPWPESKGSTSSGLPSTKRRSAALFLQRGYCDRFIHRPTDRHPPQVLRRDARIARTALPRCRRQAGIRRWQHLGQAARGSGRGDPARPGRTRRRVPRDRRNWSSPTSRATATISAWDTRSSTRRSSRKGSTESPGPSRRRAAPVPHWGRPSSRESLNGHRANRPAAPAGTPPGPLSSAMRRSRRRHAEWLCVCGSTAAPLMVSPGDNRGVLGPFPVSLFGPVSAGPTRVAGSSRALPTSVSGRTGRCLGLSFRPALNR